MPAPVNALVDELEVRGDGVVGGVVAGERLGEVEDEVAVDARERVQDLGEPSSTCSVASCPSLPSASATSSSTSFLSSVRVSGALSAAPEPDSSGSSHRS